MIINYNITKFYKFFPCHSSSSYQDFVIWFYRQTTFFGKSINDYFIQ